MQCRDHNFEERLNIVSRLQSGEPIEPLCKELKLDKKMVRLWYLRYKKYGEEGLRGTRYSHYTAGEKLAIEKGVFCMCHVSDMTRADLLSLARLCVSLR